MYLTHVNEQSIDWIEQWRLKSIYLSCRTWFSQTSFLAMHQTNVRQQNDSVAPQVAVLSHDGHRQSIQRRTLGLVLVSSCILGHLHQSAAIGRREAVSWCNVSVPTWELDFCISTCTLPNRWVDSVQHKSPLSSGSSAHGVVVCQPGYILDKYSFSCEYKSFLRSFLS